MQLGWDYGISCRNRDNAGSKGGWVYHFATIRSKNEDRKRFKVCLKWKVNLAYPASFQALHSNN